MSIKPLTAEEEREWREVHPSVGHERLWATLDAARAALEPTKDALREAIADARSNAEERDALRAEVEELKKRMADQ